MKKILLSLTLATIMMPVYADHHGAHWGYTGDTGATQWGNLSAEYKLCNTGKNQSPIDISSTIEADLPKITLDYQAGGTEVVNNGHTIQVNFAAGSSMQLGERKYQLKQFHFHAPSENLIDGKSYPLEAHLVHADDQGNLAVIGVMFVIGEANKGIDATWAKMPHQAGGKAALDNAISAMDLLPTDHDYYRFNGSLTTPPCSEGVAWMVLKQPLTVSQAQIDQFAKLMGGANNRPVQPVNARPVLK